MVIGGEGKDVVVASFVYRVCYLVPTEISNVEG